jgi:hypothetical protein
MITMIYDVYKDSELITVKAVIEDFVMVYPATNIDPPEYGPALCEASFTLDHGETLPEDEEDLINFLENLDLNWKMEDNSDYYID